MDGRQLGPGPVRCGRLTMGSGSPADGWRAHAKCGAGSELRTRHPRAVGVVVNHAQALTQRDGEALRAVTTNTSLAKGRDPRYLTQDAGAGHAGGTRYYTEAAGEPPGRWAGEGAAALGLAGEVDADGHAGAVHGRRAALGGAAERPA